MTINWFVSRSLFLPDAYIHINKVLSVDFQSLSLQTEVEINSGKAKRFPLHFCFADSIASQSKIVPKTYFGA